MCAIQQIFFSRNGSVQMRSWKVHKAVRASTWDLTEISTQSAVNKNWDWVMLHVTMYLYLLNHIVVCAGYNKTTRVFICWENAKQACSRAYVHFIWSPKENIEHILQENLYMFDVLLMVEERLSETAWRHAELGKGTGNYLCCLHAH